MREPTYGETLYQAYHKIRTLEPTPWDDLSLQEQSLWDNNAACVLALYHKRQIALSRQTQPQPKP